MRLFTCERLASHACQNALDRSSHPDPELARGRRDLQVPQRGAQARFGRAALAVAQPVHPGHEAALHRALHGPGRGAGGLQGGEGEEQSIEKAVDV